MPAYVTIPNSQIDQDSPVTQPLLTALRDNPIAIIEGDPTAPKVVLKTLERIEAGTAIRARWDAEVSGGSITMGFIQIGTIRFTFTHRAATSASLGSVEVSRVRSGVTTQLALYPNSTANVARSLDIDILPGDLVQLTRNVASSAVFTSLVRFQTNGQNLWPVNATGVNVEGNVHV